MKPENIKEKHAKRKREAAWGVFWFGLIQVLVAAMFVAFCFIPDLPKWLMVCFVVFAVLCLAAILPAVQVLKARWKEIEGGELDAAAKY